MHSTRMHIMFMLITIIQRILVQAQIRLATIHLLYAITITVKAIVLSVNGSNIHRKRSS